MACALIAQSHADMCIVQVVGRTDAYVVYADRCPFLLSLSRWRSKRSGSVKKVRFREIAVQDPHPIVGVKGTHQAVACLSDRHHVPRSNVTCGAYQCKVPATWFFLSVIRLIRVCKQIYTETPNSISSCGLSAVFIIDALITAEIDEYLRHTRARAAPVSAMRGMSSRLADQQCQPGDRIGISDGFPSPPALPGTCLGQSCQAVHEHGGADGIDQIYDR
jgi:hypothetical protein